MDEPLGIMIDPGNLNLAKGGSERYLVRLNLQVTSPAEVMISPADAASGVTVSPERLVFLPENWNMPQAVSVAAANDATGKVTLRHSVYFGGFAYGDFEAGTVDVLVTDD